MVAELKNPVTLETLDSLLLESGVAFEKSFSQYANGSGYQGMCSFSSNSLPLLVSVEYDHVATNFGSYQERKILRKVKYGSNRQHPDYEFVDGRFRFDERHGNPERRSSAEPLIRTSNAILDKIDNLGLSKEFGATQGLLQNQVSKMLGSYGMCNGEDAFRTCNYRVNLDDGSLDDVSIMYLKSVLVGDYAPLSMWFNENETAKGGGLVKTVRIGRQEWMDHNVLFGEGLTGKYGVALVGNEDLSNITSVAMDRLSYAVPSGEANSWFVMMDLNLRALIYQDFIEKPDIKENHRGVCPVGFHVPTRAEWEELISYVAMDMVKFRSYSLFRDYAKAYEADDTKAMSRINDELDASYSRWRKGRKDVFDCRDGEKCRFNVWDMQCVIEEEIVKHLCKKGAWPLDENGNDQCLDSYGFSMLPNSLTGGDMSYWTADANISKCRDVFEKGRHQCVYDIEGLGFTVKYGASVKKTWQGFEFSRIEPRLGFANLRCLKNRENTYISR